MKKIIFVCLTLWLNAAVFAQVSYTLRIMDVYGKPMSNIEVTAINNDIGLTLKSKTDMNGCALFTLTKAGMYTFSYLEMKDVKSFEMPENVKGQSKSTVTYDPEKIFEWKPCNRSGIVFKSQTPLQLKGQTNIAKVTIEVLQNDNTIVPDVAVDIVDCKNKIKYAAKANSAGIAVFYVPVNQEYEVDIAGSEALRKLKLPNHSYMEYKETVFYEKTKVKGTIKGDTILQKQITQGEGTTTHLLFTFKLKDYNSNPLPDEPVYVCAENNKRVYEGLTDKNGACRFMLEKGNNYIINLKYEQGASFVEASNTKGFATAEETRTYRGSKNIEKMLAERHMNEKGFVVNHNETPIRPAPRPVNYLKKTAQGYDVDFAPSGPVGTPTVINNKLFTQQGFYSPNFYCLDATTGQYLWGVELGESGTSPAVYHDGVLLINTYSCTLYALEASTGKMLWSKWLAGTIYSTPSADSNCVYVVYDNGGANPKNKAESFVVACFDLRSGKMNWINWIDNEVIACPVVDGKEVHIASQNGSYYVFDKASGQPLISSKTVKAVSSPTLTKENIFLTAAVNGKEQLVVLDRKSLKVMKTYSTILAPSKITDNYNCYKKMNFNGAHPIVYKNKIVVLLDSLTVRAFDATSEKILWQQPLKTNSSQIPIVANDKVIVAAKNGNVMSYDINTGTPQTLQKSNETIEGQPVLTNGAMYVGSSEILKVTKSTQKYSWNQWNKDARHNAYWE